MSSRDAHSGSLHAIVLAAGFGSRLGAHTANHHKCVVHVGGRPILSRTLDTLVAAGIPRATIVVGHLGTQVRACADAWSEQMDLCCVANNRVASTGTAHSLALGLATAVPGEGILVIEADVVFGPEALARLLHAPEQDVTLVAPFGDNGDGSAVLCDANARVVDWLHPTHQLPGFPRDRAYKTVNLTRLDARTAAELLDYCASVRPDAPLEHAMRALVRARDTRIHAVAVRGAPWCEVDTPRDLRLAEELFGVGARAGDA